MSSETGRRSATPASPAEKLRAALDLHTAGVELMRQNLRRRNPNATDLEIARRLHEWLMERPGAEFGDCQGRPVDIDSRTA